jgi:3-isopropylmalate dehydrogenase
MSHAHITVLPGDGIGPEIIEQGVAVLRAIASRFGHEFVIHEALIGGAAIDVTGVPLPPETLAHCQESDAVLLGAVGGPRWDHVPANVRPERGLLAIRKELGLYANIRPVAVPIALANASSLKPSVVQGVDLIVVRELTGGIYFGEKSTHVTADGETATDVCTYTTSEIARVVRAAATLARTRRCKVTSVDKANVLETSRLWRRVATQVMADEFPDIACEHLLVDACAMHLIRRPRDFDVIVTENMFGDILTDEASMLVGSIGLLPSASLGDPGTNGRALGLYEPIHGSAPDIAGRGIANPIGAISSVAMLLRHSLGLEEEARCVERAVLEAVAAGDVTVDVDATAPKSTAAVGASIVRRVAMTVMHDAVA